MRDDVRFSASHLLLKRLRVLEKSEVDCGLGYIVYRIWRAVTGQAGSFDGDRGMMWSSRNWSVLDFGRWRRISYIMKCIELLNIYVWDEILGFHVSHVNSDGLRNAAKTIQKATRRLMLSWSFCKMEMMVSKMSLMISRRSRIDFLPYIRNDPWSMRWILGSSKTSILRSFSMW